MRDSSSDAPRNVVDASSDDSQRPSEMARVRSYVDRLQILEDRVVRQADGELSVIRWTGEDLTPTDDGRGLQWWFLLQPSQSLLDDVSQVLRGGLPGLAGCRGHVEIGPSDDPEAKDGLWARLSMPLCCSVDESLMPGLTDAVLDAVRPLAVECRFVSPSDELNDVRGNYVTRVINLLDDLIPDTPFPRQSVATYLNEVAAGFPMADPLIGARAVIAACQAAAELRNPFEAIFRVFNPKSPNTDLVDPEEDQPDPETP